VLRQKHQDGHSFSIHRSLQKNILHGLQHDKDSKKRRRIFEEVFVMIDQCLPPASRLQQNDKNIWPMYHKFVPQVISVMTNSQWPDPPLELSLKFAHMLSSIGTFLWHTGRFRDCEIAMKEAETALLKQDDQFKTSPEFEELISDIYLVTGIVADCVGVSQRKQSLEHRHELLRLRNKELDRIPVSQRTVDDEIRWGNAKGDLACAFMQRDRYADAKAIMEELLPYYQKWGSEDEYPFEYSKYYHHSAFILMVEGAPDEALRYARKSIQLELLHAGEEDSSVLIAMYDLGCLLYNAGDLTESLACHQNVLEKRRANCGESSQYTLESYEAVGILYFAMAKYNDAK
jgi:tetratricopeptide (TPR) repeat protein